MRHRSKSVRLDVTRRSTEIIQARKVVSAQVKQGNLSAEDAAILHEAINRTQDTLVQDLIYAR